MASFAPTPPPQGRPQPSGMVRRRPPTGFDPRSGGGPQPQVLSSPLGSRGRSIGRQPTPIQGRGAPGAVNPYRNPRGMTPELLAQMARRRLGG